MKHSSIRILNHCNQQFYESYAESFDDSRQFFWQGWEQAKPYIEDVWARQQTPKPTLAKTQQKQISNPSTDFHVLDLGCGNGRFAHWLQQIIATQTTAQNANQQNATNQQLTTSVFYHGVDTNTFLLQQAATNAPDTSPDVHNWHFQWEQADIIDELLTQLTKEQEQKQEQSYDLIVVFGVMHHIPSQALRNQLLTHLAGLLKNSGIMIISTWQFDTLPNLFKRAKPLSELTIIPDPEAGDYMLDWKRMSPQNAIENETNEPTKEAASNKTTPQPSIGRYCHLISEAEINQWITSTNTNAQTPQANNIKTMLHYQADGPQNISNHYWIFRKAS